jgi:hypothetical protein
MGRSLEGAQALDAPLEHPVGLALHPRHLADDVLRQAALGLEDVVLGV